MIRVGDEVVLNRHIYGLGNKGESFYVVDVVGGNYLKLIDRFCRTMQGLWETEFFEKICKSYKTITIPLERYESLIIAENELKRLEKEREVMK